MTTEPTTAEADEKPCCGGYREHNREHRYSCPSREWPATATPEVRRLAVRGDSIAPAHAQIEDLVGGGLDYEQRKRLTEILAGVWDHGREYGSRATSAEREIRARVAADLRRAAAGRREYARTASKDADERDRVEVAADAYESAAGIAEDPMQLLGLIPSWSWTAEEHAAVTAESQTPPLA
jgi:hypothetical protein